MNVKCVQFVRCLSGGGGTYTWCATKVYPNGEYRVGGNILYKIYQTSSFSFSNGATAGQAIVAPDLDEILINLFPNSLNCGFILSVCDPRVTCSLSSLCCNKMISKQSPLCSAKVNICPQTLTHCRQYSRRTGDYSCQ